MRQAIVAGVTGLLLHSSVACGVAPAELPAPAEEATTPDTEPIVLAPDTCPARASAPTPLPGTPAELESLDYWLARAEATDGVELDTELMNDAAIDASNQVYVAREQRFDFNQPTDIRTIERMVSDRVAFVLENLATDAWVDENGAPLEPALSEAIRAWRTDMTQMQEVYAQSDIQLRCAPTDRSFYTPTLDLRFDRNNCSVLRQGQSARLIGPPANGMQLVQSTWTLGWVPEGAALAPAGGLGVRSASPAFTRRQVLTRAFSMLGQPYGWGGEGGGWDCSDFIMTVFEPFGLLLPRFSAHQGRAGVFTVDVSEATNPRDRLAVLDAAHRHGVVLLHFPGHVMLYLGRDADGDPRILHSFAEYITPCETPDNDTETLFMVDRVAVSGLELGAGSSRTSFLERLTHITVFGAPPDASLQAAAALREPAPVVQQCPETTPGSVFVTPLQPHAERVVRMVAVSDSGPGPMQAVAFSSDGQRFEGTLRRAGGPPWGVVAEFDLPAGEYTAVIGDGGDIHACSTLRVAARPQPWAGGGSGAWQVRNAWSRNVEAFYSVWVEALFDYPIDDEMTWPNLHTVLRDEEHNLLFDHYGRGEEQAFRLAPDCADLPYLLRGYFAWKLGLPFGYRQCSRGRAGSPPTCGDLITHADFDGSSDPVTSFERFMNRGVRNGVHSGSGRTSPFDDDTDWYPVDISRDGIRPGALFADPFGHLMVVTQWIPPALGSYGMLFAADAQPDATIGRPRFWRGTFLFTPETDSVGAGFKAWRPLVRAADGWRQLTNDELRSTDERPQWSDIQYSGTTDEFYDRIEGVVNPRALDPLARMEALIAALHESVNRRVISVNNAQEYLAANGRRTIDMPTGTGIFLTVGPWEDFSTPARDMRLLIAIDTVVRFPDVVRNNPEQFGLRDDEVEAEVARVQQALDAALAERTMTYTRSDGQPQVVTLAEIVARAENFEMAYHPNDCPEIRWGAPAGSEEMSHCREHAPASHRERMAEYRPWFESRQRPAR